MTVRRACAALTLTLSALPAAARERSEVPRDLTWNLSEVFASEEAWRAARDDVKRRIPALAANRGHLGESAEALRRALDELFAIDRALSAVYAYASMLADEDTRAARPREMRQEVQQLAVDLGAARAFVQPELLQAGPEGGAFAAAEPRLAPYRHFLDDVLRWKPHTLSAAEEKVAAEAEHMNSAQAIYGTLKDADLPWPTVKLSTGEVRLDNAAFTLHRAAPDRADRDLVFERFFGTYATYARTFGATFYASVKASTFDARVHGFGSSLQAALFRDAIPPSVYRQLVADVRRSLPTFHRYLALRKRMLGLEKLRYQDLYVPLVGKVEMSFTPGQAMAVALQAVAPLGPEYAAALRKGFESRWTDFLPSTGKRPGAYSSGVYGVHPYQLLNFNGKYEDLTTLAHEAGHSMHFHLAHAAQPYPTADYSIFVAEVASTLNENLLLHHMLGKAKGDAARLALLGNYLDGVRGTLFRQTQFAEFELAAHEMAERGETLTGENLTALYLGITRQYYGHEKGICAVDDLIGAEWAYIPHFYRAFYVYQYATSHVASTALARAIRDEAPRGRTRARDAYLAMLRAGGSRYPVDLLRAAGVDPTTSAPFDAATAEMNRVMDEMEKILARGAAR
jgi:oligoendopeptidase F